MVLEDLGAPPLAHRPRVLVVEGNPEMNGFITQCLSRDYEVISASDGRDGLDQAKRFRPALIVTDIMAPHVSGVEMLESLRTIPELADTYVMLLSTKEEDEQLMLKLLADGARDFIVKPFSEQDLQVRVRNLIVARQLADEQARSLNDEQEEGELARTLERIGGTVATELDVHRIVQMVTDEATRLVGAQFGAFFYNVLDERGESYTLYTLSGVPREAFAAFPMPRNTAVFEPTFRGTAIVRSGDITKDPRYGHNAPHHGMPRGHLPVRSYLAVPVVSRGKTVLGGLFFGHERTDVFTERHERLVVGIASWAAVAMDNARLYENEVRARAQLERALLEAQEARAEAERANFAKSQFLAAMSHELRTPLNAIQGHVQLLEMGLRGPLTPEQAETLGRVQRSQRVLQSLINDVLNFARVEAGRVDYEIQLVDVREVLASVVQMVEPQLAAKTLTLTVDVPASLRVAADPDKLLQILVNLLSNAIKFTDAGGRVSIDAPRRAGLADEVVYLRVSDTGRGVPRDKQEEIFDPFVQLERSAPGEPPGVGLGLAISRDLARGMNGDLRVRSFEGLGSAFTITLPRG